jgi:hypothetical protein
LDRATILALCPAPDSRGDDDEFAGAQRVAQWTLRGPLTKSLRRLDVAVEQLAVDPRGPTLYGLRQGEVLWFDDKTDRVLAVALGHPQLDSIEASAIAFDTTRNRLLLTTRDAALCAYDVKSKKCSLLARRAVAADALAYDPAQDAIYAVNMPTGGRGPRTLTRLNAYGAVLGQAPLSASERPAGAAADRALMPPQAFCVEGHLVVIEVISANGSMAGPAVLRLHVMNPQNGQIVFHGRASEHDGDQPPTEAELAALWEQLAVDLEEAAYQPLSQFATGGDVAVRYLESRLKQARPIDLDRVGKLIEQLDAEQFSKREQASAELAALGGAIEPQLALALRHPSPEVQRRAKTLLDLCQQTGGANSGPRRERRALEALRLIGTPVAVEAIERLAEAKTTPPPLARAAKSTLRQIDDAAR